MSPSQKVHAKLELKGGNFRLLHLRKGAGGDPISCTLRNATLDDTPDFEATSYVWGDVADRVVVQVNEESFAIPTALRDLLECLRLPDEERTLWADSICIEQDNVEEKGHQIQLMSRIYTQARQVHVWLGHFTDAWQSQIPPDLGYLPTSRASKDVWERTSATITKESIEGTPLEFTDKEQEILQLQQFEKSPKSLLQPTLRAIEELAAGAHFYEFPIYRSVRSTEESEELRLNPYWLTIHDCLYWILTRNWWERVWTFQEAVLPDADPLLHVGDVTVSFSTILDAAGGYVKHYMGCCQRFRSAWHGCERVVAFRAEEPLRRVLQAREIREYMASPDKKPGPSILRMALRASSLRKTSEARDRFFGILGLIDRKWTGWRDTFTRPLHEYTEVDIFAHCTMLLMAISHRPLSRDSLGFRETTVDGLPSWVIDFTKFDRRQSWSDIYSWEDVYFQDLPDITRHVITQHDGLQLRIRAARVDTVDLLVPLADDQAHLEAVNETSRAAFWQEHVYDCWKVLPEHIREATVVTPNHVWVETGGGGGYSDKVDKVETRFAAFWSKMTLSITNEVAEDSHSSDLYAAGYVERHSELEFIQQQDEASLVELQYRKDAIADTIKLPIQTLYDTFTKNTFFRATSGLPAVAPRAIVPGDGIYVVEGCPAPALLRPRKDGEGDVTDGTRFTLIGLCYIPGYMNTSYYVRYKVAEDDWQEMTLC